jgi:hypothetical protein
MVAFLVIKNDNHIEMFTPKCFCQNDDTLNRTTRLINKRIADKAGIDFDGWFGLISFVFDAIKPFLKEVTNMSKLHRLGPIQMLCC